MWYHRWHDAAFDSIQFMAITKNSDTSALCYGPPPPPGHPGPPPPDDCCGCGPGGCCGPGCCDCGPGRPCRGALASAIAATLTLPCFLIGFASCAFVAPYEECI
ncbi:hypothetical protein HUJ05_013112 [Dendroctonus ponderosae]|nr:hypothetical protein HUJ05_013112 [Dendroctonus ponderosae]